MIKYKIEKSKQSRSYIIWKEIQDKRSCGCHPVYRGRTLKECKKVLKEIKAHKYKINIKRDVIDKELEYYE